MVTDTEKFNKALGYLHIIEEKYGSIMRCPDDDPDYQAIRKIYHEDNKHGAYRLKVERMRSKNPEIIYLAKKGYPSRYIIDQTKVTAGHVYYTLSQNRIKPLHTIYHKVITSSGQIWYVSSIMDLFKKYFHICIKNNWQAGKVLKAKGYFDIRGKYYWPDIPMGCYYYFSYMDRPFKKTSPSPYI